MLACRHSSMSENKFIYFNIYTGASYTGYIKKCKNLKSLPTPQDLGYGVFGVAILPHCLGILIMQNNFEGGWWGEF